MYENIIADKKDKMKRVPTLANMEIRHLEKGRAFYVGKRALKRWKTFAVNRIRKRKSKK